MPKTNRTAWVKALKESLNTGSLYTFVSGLAFLAVFVLYVVCISQPVNSIKTLPVNNQQAILNQFCPCTCCQASAISPFFIKLPHYMLNQTHRLVIYASDIRQLTGCSKSTSHLKMKKLKKKLGKEAHQHLSIEEYCTDMGLKYEKTLEQLKLK